MKLYFGLFIMCYVTDIYVLAQQITCNSSNICKPHMFNGHYIQWPSSKEEAAYLRKKDVIPKNIIFTRFQICGNRVFLISPRYR